MAENSVGSNFAAHMLLLTATTAFGLCTRRCSTALLTLSSYSDLAKYMKNTYKDVGSSHNDSITRAVS